MTSLFFREWRVFALVVGIILITGLTSLLTIGRQEDPTITNIFATIKTPYPGVSPARVESLVTEKIEEELKEIQQIKDVVSTSRQGFSLVSVELLDTLTDNEIEATWSEIRDQMADAATQFPAGVDEPSLDTDFGASTIISGLTASDGSPYNEAILGRYADLLFDLMVRQPGAENVEIYGRAEEEIQVLIDPRRLNQLGLTAQGVSAAITAGDAKVRAGQLRANDGNLLIEVAGEIETLGRVGDMVVRRADDGSILRVRDIASVTRSVRDPAPDVAMIDGKPGVMVAVRMSEGAQVDSWVAGVRQELAKFEQTLPGGITHKILFDQSGYTTGRLATLAKNMLLGSSLVVLVLFFTLGWRGALIVACILPLTTLGSVTVLQFLGVPIHQMSVAGLIVALGLLVDAAIVMTDDVRRRLLDRQPRLNSVEQAVRRLGVPLLASTVTTVLAFMPMAILPGPAGDFLGSIALAVIVMLITSFLLALTVTPALAGWILPDADYLRTHQRWVDRGISAGALGRWFSRSLDWALANKGVAIFGAAALPVVGFMAFGTLTAQFFPGVERDQFFVELNSDGLASLNRSLATTRLARELVIQDPDVVSADLVVGRNAPPFYYNMPQRGEGNTALGQILVTTRDPKATRRAIPRLQRRLNEALPNAQSIVRGLTQGPPVNAPVEIEIIGPNLTELRRIGDEIRAVLTRTPNIIHTKANLGGGRPKALLDLDEDKVNRAGLTLAAVAQFLEDNLEGAVGGSLVEATEELPVRVRLDEDWRGELDLIRSLDIPVPSADGSYRAIPLLSLGDITLTPSDSVIVKKQGERVNIISGFIPFDVLPATVLAAFEAELAKTPVAIPGGYRLQYGGDSEARSNTVGNLVSSIGLIVVLTIATIVLTFNSFRLSIITGCVAILAVGMSLLALEVFGYPFGVQALIGVIGSIGVSINAAIIILTGLQNDERASMGDVGAVRDVVIASSRHIISTTTTTFGGFLPLILEGGGFWPPFAMSIAGGVLLSTIISFYFTPPAYLLTLGRKRRAAAERGSQSRQGFPDDPLASEAPEAQATQAPGAAEPSFVMPKLLGRKRRPRRAPITAE